MKTHTFSERLKQDLLRATFNLVKPKLMGIYAEHEGLDPLEMVVVEEEYEEFIRNTLDEALDEYIYQDEAKSESNSIGKIITRKFFYDHDCGQPKCAFSDAVEFNEQAKEADDYAYWSSL